MGANVEEPIITYSDDWKHKSDQERRRWAFEHVFRGDASIDDAITAAERLVNYVNGQQSASVQSPSLGATAVQHPSETPDLPPRVTSEFLEQSA